MQPWHSRGSGGGVVIWDEQGNLVGAFSAYHGEGTNTKAEFLALRDGLSFRGDPG